MIKRIKDNFLYNDSGIRYSCECSKCGNKFGTTDPEKQYDCPNCGNFLNLSTKERNVFKKCSCGTEFSITDSIKENICKCPNCKSLYNFFGEPLNDCDFLDSYEEISKAVEHKGGELKHKELKMPTTAAKKLGQAINGIVATDSREYIGEYNEEYYERYRGITIYKQKISDYDYDYIANFLEENYKAKTAKELREKLDEAITKYVEKYAKNFEVKK